ncbi:hypothetical protein OPAG_06022 [Rhodococcus opacus PD630]|nr:hypothetical protein OPAG_06022 [Rhodococcus opacus PD630]
MPGDRPSPRAFPRGFRSRPHCWESLPHGWGHAGPPGTCRSVRNVLRRTRLPPVPQFPDSNGSGRAKWGSRISGTFRLGIEPSG